MMLQKRQDELDAQYNAADEARSRAESDESYWKEKRATLDTEADEIMKNASDNAKIRSERILDDARERAEGILRKAEEDAELEKRRAADTIKREIVDVSAILAEKMLSREINIDDHRNIIDSVIEKIGDDDDSNK